MVPYDDVMRVVQVSAHYPPNFVSGGTLVPHRIARELARRGHESHVYAGHLDAARTPLSTWTDEDDAGVRVRWVVTTPWTGWADPRNSDNPAVEQDFARYLDDLRPDVVHVHSLQTLGGGIVTAAKDGGAAVVVTMHDFWWSCARQFLVDRDMRPCSLVVDCGDCDCQVTHEWLLARNARLAEHVAKADLVLAPSRSAARVFEANGVDPARLRVDENGVPDEVLDRLGRRRPDPEPGGRLRLMFAGGEDPMKGLPVLLDALRGLPDDGAWEADLFGVAHVPRDLPAGVHARPGYRPEELSEVLARHDVLVLPSVMRESHSIVTREALAAGLAVVCTDTLGPEEAVEHGENGLVVPAGDAVALLAALRRLVGDPELVGRLRDHPAAAGLRSAKEQIDGLEALYASLVGSRSAGRGEPVTGGGERSVPRGGTPAAPPLGAAPLGASPLGAPLPGGPPLGAGDPQKVLFVVGINGAPLRYRVRLAAEALRLDGASPKVRHYRDPELPDLAARAEAIVFYRVPATRQVLELASTARERRPVVPILFDVDDLIFDPGLRGQVHGLEKLSPEEEALWWRGVARYRTTMEAADLYVGSTEALCRHAADLTGLPARRFANGVGMLMARRSEAALRRARTPGPLRIGYFSGTTTHDEDWARVEPGVLAFMGERPDAELWLGGHLVPTAALAEVAGRVRRLPMLPWYELPGRLRDLDINLAPLVPGSIFNEAKSAIKWLESALVATPTVATPTQPFREAIDAGRTGLLATDAPEWHAALRRLADDDVERARIGTLARREALLTYSPHRQARVYRQILRDALEVAQDRAANRTSTWEPVFDDEPLSAADAWVEPYRDGTQERPSLLPRTRLTRDLEATVRVLRAAGVRGAAGKIRRRLTRS